MDMIVNQLTTINPMQVQYFWIGWPFHRQQMWFVLKGLGSKMAPGNQCEAAQLCLTLKKRDYSLKKSRVSKDQTGL